MEEETNPVSLWREQEAGTDPQLWEGCRETPPPSPPPPLLGEGHRTTMTAGSWASKQKPAAPIEDETMLPSLKPNTILSRVWQLQGHGVGMTRYCLSRTNSKGKLEIQRKRSPSISTVVLTQEQQEAAATHCGRGSESLCCLAHGQQTEQLKLKTKRSPQ